MDGHRSIDLVVVLNDNSVFKDAFMNGLQSLRATDACASTVWRGTYDASGTSWYLANLQIKSVPELPDVLTADTPPSFSWFLTLPPVRELDKSVLQDFVLVYAVCLQKPGAEDKIYFGSAFSVADACYGRVSTYRGPTRSKMALYVGKALDIGYKIVHMGALFIVELDYYHRTPFAHSGIIGLEAWSTFHFWGVYRGSGPDAVGDRHYLRHICPWGSDELDYGGLCSHSALMESLTIGPPGLYEGHETMQRLLEENVEAFRRYKVALKDRNKLAVIVASAYANGETSDIVDKYRDEEVLDMIKLGDFLLEREHNYWRSPAGRASQEKLRNKVRSGRELGKKVAQGTLAIDSDDEDVAAAAVAMTERVKVAKADTTVVAATKRSKTVKTDDPVVATTKQVKAIKAAVKSRGYADTRNAVRQTAADLVRELKAGTLVKEYSDLPVDPETGYAMDIPVATEEQLRLLEMGEKRAASKRVAKQRKSAKLAVGAKLLEEVAAGSLVRSEADRPVHPQTGAVVEVPVATKAQLESIAFTEKLRANNAANSKDSYHARKAKAVGKENVDPAGYDSDVVMSD